MQAMGIPVDFGNQGAAEAEEFIGSAMEAQDVQSQFTVLTSTKGIAGMLTAEQASSCGFTCLVTKFDDETILSAESLMLTFTRWGKDVFPGSYRGGDEHEPSAWAGFTIDGRGAWEASMIQEVDGSYLIEQVDNAYR